LVEIGYADGTLLLIVPYPFVEPQLWISSCRINIRKISSHSALKYIIKW
jgi:hypothetical protein